jgi:hypothetical protein
MMADSRGERAEIRDQSADSGALRVKSREEEQSTEGPEGGQHI